MVRLILYFILFYLIYRTVKNLLSHLAPPKQEIKGKPKTRIKPFDPSDIEDIEYKEVKTNDEEPRQESSERT